MVLPPVRSPGFGLVLALALAPVLPGCLSRQYEIDRAELTRLAQLAPEQRGERVRVVQQTSFGTDRLPTQSPPIATEPDAEVLVTSDDNPEHREPYRDRSVYHRSDVKTPAPSRSGASVGGAGAATAVAAAALVVPATAFFVAAPTEGQRFDGWASVEPSQPLMLIDHAGKRRWVTIGDFGTGDAARANRGVILDDGAMQRLTRAPLDRFGFASRLELGAASLSALRGTADYAPQARLAFGGFPLHRVGILVGAQFAAGSVEEPSTPDSTVFNGRVFGEIDWLPLRLGQFYGGVFAEVGAGLVRQDVGGASTGKTGMSTAGGALCEIALNTRLALSIRANAASIPSLTAASSVWIPEFALGLSVY